MNAPPGNLVTVQPERMLTVMLQYPGRVVQLNAISCRYISASLALPAPHPVVAVEVIRDPMNQMPIEAYVCNTGMLEVIVLPANALLQVRPYLIYPAPGANPVELG
jgi:hypothetical protein